MSQKILARGAEAILTKQRNNVVLKDRIKKSYRIPEIDNKLRKQRTKSEAKLISKASSIIPVPKLLPPVNNKSSTTYQPRTKYHDNNYRLRMGFIKGKLLSKNLDKLEYKKICKQIGKNIAKLHDSGLIHGDLTTSNMIYVPNKKQNNNKTNRNSDLNINNSASSGKVYFIDFGLGFHSNRIEDKAVDLHLIKQALQAKHPSIYEKAFKAILLGYRSSKNYSKTITRLKKVEKRGRYKKQY